MVIGAALAALPVWHAHAEVLVYQDANKWVAQEKNAPLMALMQKARDGKNYFKVDMPANDRELSIARLQIVRDILAREAGRAVVLEEVGISKSNTLRIE